MNQARNHLLVILVSAVLTAAPHAARAEDRAGAGRDSRSATSAPLAEMRAAALAAADVEPERRPLQGALTPAMRRDLLRHIVRQELAQEARPGLVPAGPALARRAEVPRTERGESARASEEAVKAQGAERGRKVANDHAKDPKEKPGKPDKAEKQVGNTSNSLTVGGARGAVGGGGR